MSETTEKLLNLAEDQIRLKGYHAVSFRDLASELGIKSASVHYYFPQKKDLGVAIVDRYSENFFVTLNNASATCETSQCFLKAIINVYRAALIESNRVCLCGILGSESSGLPEEINEKVSAFLKQNVAWLAEKLPADFPEEKRIGQATSIISTLQGAMILSNSMKDNSIFVEATKNLSVT